MARLQDLMARSKAAGQMAGMPPEEMGMPPAGAPPPTAGMPPEGEGADLETSLTGVEQAVSAVAPEALEDVMVHLNAIRELVSAPSGQGGEGAVPEPSAEPGVSEAKNVEGSEGLPA